MIWAALLRPVAFVGGLLLIYLGAFIYSTEQKRLQNRIEEWWLLVDDLRERGLRRQTAFMVVVAQKVTAGFDALFGPRLVSLGGLGASAAYSFALMIASVMVGAAFFPPPDGAMTNRVRAPWLVVFAVLAALRLIDPRLGRYQLGLTAVALALALYIHRHTARVGGFENTSAWFAVHAGALVISTASNVSFIALTRRMLRRTAQLDSFRRIMGMFLKNLTVAVALTAIPLLVAGVIMTNSRRSNPWAQMWGLAGVGNLVTALTALTFAVAAIIMLLHLLTWPLICRPLYLVANERLLTHRKALVVSGLTLVSIAFPSVGDFLKSLVR